MTHMKPGVRWNTYLGKIDAVSAAATPFLPSRNFPEVDGVPSWKDASLRVGASYNLFSSGKTAIRGSVGKYNQGQTAGASFMTPYNPVSSGITAITDTRN